VNFIRGHPELEELLDVIVGEKVAVASYGKGNPKHIISRTKPAGIINLPTMGSVKHAVRAEQDGADAVIVQGTDLAAVGAEGAAELYHRVLDGLEADGIPILDGFDADSLRFEPGGGEAHNAARLAGLRPGVNYLICHPARQGPELAAITPDAHMRDFERRFYGGEAGWRAFEEQGLRRVGMRPLRDLVRAGTPSPRGRSA